MIVISQNGVRQHPPRPKAAPPAPVPKRRDTTRDQAIIRMWPTHAVQQIADELGYSLANSVSKRAKTLGLPAKEKGRRPSRGK